MNSEETELLDFANTPQPQAQADKWTADDEEQWNRITERGTVLSRYICSDHKPHGLNFAVCESDGWQIFRSDDIDFKRDRLEEFMKKFGPKLTPDLSRIMMGHSFCENVKKEQLKNIGRICRLDIGDWARATRWANLPDSIKYDDKGRAWMFLEIPTIWKKKKLPPEPGNEFKAPENTPMLNLQTSTTMKFSRSQSVSIWRPRRIAIFFSWHSGDIDSGNTESESTTSKRTSSENTESQNTGLRIMLGKNGGSAKEGTGERSWTCLVLIEPIKTNDDEHLLFCYRKVHIEDSVNNPQPNANCIAGRRRYTIEEDELQETIHYIAKELLPEYVKRGPKSNCEKCLELITHLGKDICWGWEEFATQVVQTSAVYEPAKWIESLDRSDPCWELFSYYSILNESRYLSRALKCLSVITGPGTSKRAKSKNFKELYSSLETVKSDVDKASEFVKGTIEMIYNYLSIKEAGCAARTNNNMEYLAILASIFLPLTLLIGAFGMNIGVLGQGQLSWWVPIAVSLPSTVVVCGLIYLGKRIWRKYREQSLNEGWRIRYQHMIRV